MLENTHIQFADLPYFLGACVFFLLMIRLLLVSTDEHTKRANYYLIGLFGIFSAQELDEFFSFIVEDYALPVLLEYLMYCSHLLLGPLTYLYTANMIKEQYGLLSSIKHAIPFAFMLFIATTFHLLFDSETAEKPLLVIFISLYFFTLLPYVLMSLNKLNQYLGKSKNLFSDLHNHNLNWARFWLIFMLFLALYVVANPILKLSGVIKHHPFEIHYFIAAAGLILLVWPHSAAQRALPIYPEEGDIKNQDHKNVEENFVPIFDNIEKLVKEKKVYLINGLTLKDLSDASGYCVEDISRAINQVGGICFYDFINDYRIEESKRLLRANQSSSILDIALESGFSSKSAFYTAFKKRVGITPSLFRNRGQC